MTASKDLKDPQDPKTTIAETHAWLLAHGTDPKKVAGRSKLKKEDWVKMATDHPRYKAYLTENGAASVADLKEEVAKAAKTIEIEATEAAETDAPAVPDERRAPKGRKSPTMKAKLAKEKHRYLSDNDGEYWYQGTRADGIKYWKPVEDEQLAWPIGTATTRNTRPEEERQAAKAATAAKAKPTEDDPQMTVPQMKAWLEAHGTDPKTISGRSKFVKADWAKQVTQHDDYPAYLAASQQ